MAALAFVGLTAYPIGPTTGDLTIITSGVSEGDRVVTDGQNSGRK
jgi:hypothetical protein